LGINIIYSNTYLKGRKFGIIDLGIELDNIEPERMMDISWAEGTTKTSYIAHIRIECQDRVGMLRDVIMKTGDLGINIIYSNTYLKGRKFGIIDLGV
jgi:(p)ppGpp synthase/HD superfamily hydrolase